jgi:hypothetical protein
MNPSQVMREELIEMISSMDIPLFRKELTITNLKWMQENLGIRNSDSPDFANAMSAIDWLIRNDSELPIA